MAAGGVNLFDDDVAAAVRSEYLELIAEGEPDQVEAFLGAVNQTMHRYLHKVAITDQPPENRQGFHIRY